MAKLIRVYALQQHTMREVNQLRDKFADGLTKKDSEMLHEQVKFAEKNEIIDLFI